MGVVRPPAGAVGVGEPARGEAEAGRGAPGPMSCRRRGRRRHRRDAPQRRRMPRLLRHPPAPVTCHVSGRVRGRRRIVRVVGIAVVYVGAGGVGLLHLHRHMHLHLRLHLHLHLHLRLRLWLRLPATTSALVGHLALLRPLHGAARVSDRGVHNLIIVLLFMFYLSWKSWMLLWLELRIIHVYPEADYTHMHRVASTLVHSIRRLGGMHSIELARARTKSIKRVLRRTREYLLKVVLQILIMK